MVYDPRNQQSYWSVHHHFLKRANAEDAPFKLLFGHPAAEDESYSWGATHLGGYNAHDFKQSYERQMTSPVSRYDFHTEFQFQLGGSANDEIIVAMDKGLFVVSADPADPKLLKTVPIAGRHYNWVANLDTAASYSLTAVNFPDSVVAFLLTPSNNVIYAALTNAKVYRFADDLRTYWAFTPGSVSADTNRGTPVTKLARKIGNVKVLGMLPDESVMCALESYWSSINIICIDMATGMTTLTWGVGSTSPESTCTADCDPTTESLTTAASMVMGRDQASGHGFIMVLDLYTIKRLDLSTNRYKVILGTLNSYNWDTEANLQDKSNVPALDFLFPDSWSGAPRIAGVTATTLYLASGVDGDRWTVYNVTGLPTMELLAPPSGTSILSGCSVVTHCNNHAHAVVGVSTITGCKCVCKRGYNGTDCSMVVVESEFPTSMWTVARGLRPLTALHVSADKSKITAAMGDGVWESPVKDQNTAAVVEIDAATGTATSILDGPNANWVDSCLPDPMHPSVVLAGDPNYHWLSDTLVLVASRDARVRLVDVSARVTDTIVGEPVHFPLNVLNEAKRCEDTSAPPVSPISRHTRPAAMLYLRNTAALLLGFSGYLGDYRSVVYKYTGAAAAPTILLKTMSSTSQVCSSGWSDPVSISPVSTGTHYICSILSFAVNADETEFYMAASGRTVQIRAINFAADTSTRIAGSSTYVSCGSASGRGHGSYTASSTSLCSPHSLLHFIHPNGDKFLYFIDFSNGVFRLSGASLDSLSIVAGSWSEAAYGAQDGPLGMSRLYGANGLASDSEVLFIGDTGNGRVTALRLAAAATGVAQHDYSFAPCDIATHCGGAGRAWHVDGSPATGCRCACAWGVAHTTGVSGVVECLATSDDTATAGSVFTVLSSVSISGFGKRVRVPFVSSMDFDPATNTIFAASPTLGVVWSFSALAPGGGLPPATTPVVGRVLPQVDDCPDTNSNNRSLRHPHHVHLRYSGGAATKLYVSEALAHRLVSVNPAAPTSTFTVDVGSPHCTGLPINGRFEATLPYLTDASWRPHAPRFPVMASVFRECTNEIFVAEMNTVLRYDVAADEVTVFVGQFGEVQQQWQGGEDGHHLQAQSGGGCGQNNNNYNVGKARFNALAESPGNFDERLSSLHCGASFPSLQATLISFPTDMKIQEDRYLYVVNSGHHRIFAVDLFTKQVVGFIGAAGVKDHFESAYEAQLDCVTNCLPEHAAMGRPQAMVILERTTGPVMYVTAAESHVVWAIDLKHWVANVLVGTLNTPGFLNDAGDSLLRHPTALTASSSTLYIMDSSNGVVRAHVLSGAPSGSPSGCFTAPDLAVCGPHCAPVAFYKHATEPRRDSAHVMSGHVTTYALALDPAAIAGAQTGIVYGLDGTLLQGHSGANRSSLSMGGTSRIRNRLAMPMSSLKDRAANFLATASPGLAPLEPHDSWDGHDLRARSLHCPSSQYCFATMFETEEAQSLMHPYRATGTIQSNPVSGTHEVVLIDRASRSYTPMYGGARQHDWTFSMYHELWSPQDYWPDPTDSIASGLKSSFIPVFAYYWPADSALFVSTSIELDWGSEAVAGAVVRIKADEQSNWLGPVESSDSNEIFYEAEQHRLSVQTRAPQQITIQGDAHMYVADRDAMRVRHIDLLGSDMATVIAGSGLRQMENLDRCLDSCQPWQVSFFPMGVAAHEDGVHVFIAANWEDNGLNLGFIYKFSFDTFRLHRVAGRLDEHPTNDNVGTIRDAYWAQPGPSAAANVMHGYSMFLSGVGHLVITSTHIFVSEARGIVGLQLPAANTPNNVPAPAAVDIACTVAADCSNNAWNVGGNRLTRCVCYCSDGWEGDDCSVAQVAADVMTLFSAVPIVDRIPENQDPATPREPSGATPPQHAVFNSFLGLTYNQFDGLLYATGFGALWAIDVATGAASKSMGGFPDFVSATPTYPVLSPKWPLDEFYHSHSGRSVFVESVSAGVVMTGGYQTAPKVVHTAAAAGGFLAHPFMGPFVDVGINGRLTPEDRTLFAADVGQGPIVDFRYRQAPAVMGARYISERSMLFLSVQFSNGNTPVVQDVDVGSIALTDPLSGVILRQSESSQDVFVGPLGDAVHPRLATSIPFPMQLDFHGTHLYIAAYDGVYSADVDSGAVTRLVGNGTIDVDACDVACPAAGVRGAWGLVVHVAASGPFLYFTETHLFPDRSGLVNPTLLPDFAAGHRIRRLDLTLNQLDTLAGKASTPDYVDGSLAAARFYSPTALAVDSEHLYIADSGNQRIRRLRLVAGGTGVGQSHRPTGSASQRCTSAAHCQNRAVYVAGTAASGCYCHCAPAYSGETCETTISSLVDVLPHRTVYPVSTAVRGAASLTVGPTGKLLVTVPKDHAVYEVDVSSGAASLVAGNPSALQWDAAVPDFGVNPTFTLRSPIGVAYRPTTFSIAVAEYDGYMVRHLSHANAPSGFSQYRAAGQPHHGRDEFTGPIENASDAKAALLYRPLGVTYHPCTGDLYVAMEGGIAVISSVDGSLSSYTGGCDRRVEGFYDQSYYDFVVNEPYAAPPPNWGMESTKHRAVQHRRFRKLDDAPCSQMPSPGFVDEPKSNLGGHSSTFYYVHFFEETTMFAVMFRLGGGGGSYGGATVDELVSIDMVSGLATAVKIPNSVDNGVESPGNPSSDDNFLRAVVVLRRGNNQDPILYAMGAVPAYDSCMDSCGDYDFDDYMPVIRAMNLRTRVFWRVSLKTDFAYDYSEDRFAQTAARTTGGLAFASGVLYFTTAGGVFASRIDPVGSVAFPPQQQCGVQLPTDSAPTSAAAQSIHVAVDKTYSPAGIAFGHTEGALYVVSAHLQSLLRFDSDGRVQSVAGLQADPADETKYGRDLLTDQLSRPPLGLGEPVLDTTSIMFATRVPYLNRHGLHYSAENELFVTYPSAEGAIVAQIKSDRQRTTGPPRWELVHIMGNDPRQGGFNFSPQGSVSSDGGPGPLLAVRNPWDVVYRRSTQSVYLSGLCDNEGTFAGCGLYEVSATQQRYLTAVGTDKDWAMKARDSHGQGLSGNLALQPFSMQLVESDLYFLTVSVDLIDESMPWNVHLCHVDLDDMTFTVMAGPMYDTVELDCTQDCDPWMLPLTVPADMKSHYYAGGLALHNFASRDPAVYFFDLNSSAIWCYHPRTNLAHLVVGTRYTRGNVYTSLAAAAFYLPLAMTASDSTLYVLDRYPNASSIAVETVVVGIVLFPTSTLHKAVKGDSPTEECSLARHCRDLSEVTEVRGSPITGCVCNCRPGYDCRNSVVEAGHELPHASPALADATKVYGVMSFAEEGSYGPGVASMAYNSVDGDLYLSTEQGTILQVSPLNGSVTILFGTPNRAWDSGMDHVVRNAQESLPPMWRMTAHGSTIIGAISESADGGSLGLYYAPPPGEANHDVLALRFDVTVNAGGDPGENSFAYVPALGKLLVAIDHRIVAADLAAGTTAPFMGDGTPGTAASGARAAAQLTSPSCLHTIDGDIMYFVIGDATVGPQNQILRWTRTTDINDVVLSGDAQLPNKYFAFHGLQVATLQGSGNKVLYVGCREETTDFVLVLRIPIAGTSPEVPSVLLGGGSDVFYGFSNRLASTVSLGGSSVSLAVSPNTLYIVGYDAGVVLGLPLTAPHQMNTPMEAQILCSVAADCGGDGKATAAVGFKHQCTCSCRVGFTGADCSTAINTDALFSVTTVYVTPNYPIGSDAPLPLAGLTSAGTYVYVSSPARNSVLRAYNDTAIAPFLGRGDTGPYGPCDSHMRTIATPLRFPAALDSDGTSLYLVQKDAFMTSRVTVATPAFVAAADVGVCVGPVAPTTSSPNEYLDAMFVAQRLLQSASLTGGSPLQRLPPASAVKYNRFTGDTYIALQSGGVLKFIEATGVLSHAIGNQLDWTTMPATRVAGVIAAANEGPKLVLQLALRGVLHLVAAGTFRHAAGEAHGILQLNMASGTSAFLIGTSVPGTSCTGGTWLVCDPLATELPDAVTGVAVNNPSVDIGGDSDGDSIVNEQDPDANGDGVADMDILVTYFISGTSVFKLLPAAASYSLIAGGVSPGRDDASVGTSATFTAPSQLAWDPLTGDSLYFIDGPVLRKLRIRTPFVFKSRTATLSSTPGATATLMPKPSRTFTPTATSTVSRTRSSDVSRSASMLATRSISLSITGSRSPLPTKTRSSAISPTWHSATLTVTASQSASSSGSLTVTKSLLITRSSSTSTSASASPLSMSVSKTIWVTFTPPPTDTPTISLTVTPPPTATASPTRTPPATDSWSVSRSMGISRTSSLFISRSISSSASMNPSNVTLEATIASEAGRAASRPGDIVKVNIKGRSTGQPVKYVRAKVTMKNAIPAPSTLPPQSVVTTSTDAATGITTSTVTFPLNLESIAPDPPPAVVSTTDGATSATATAPTSALGASTPSTSAATAPPATLPQPPPMKPITSLTFVVPPALRNTAPVSVTVSLDDTDAAAPVTFTGVRGTHVLAAASQPTVFSNLITTSTSVPVGAAGGMPTPAAGSTATPASSVAAAAGTPASMPTIPAESSSFGLVPESELPVITSNQPPMNTASFGTTVMLTGTHLDRLPSRLMYGSLVANVNVLSPTSAQLVMPAPPSSSQVASGFANAKPLNEQEQVFQEVVYGATERELVGSMLTSYSRPATTVTTAGQPSLTPDALFSVNFATGGPALKPRVDVLPPTVPSTLQTGSSGDVQYADGQMKLQVLNDLKQIGGVGALQVEFSVDAPNDKAVICSNGSPTSGHVAVAPAANAAGAPFVPAASVHTLASPCTFVSPVLTDTVAVRVKITAPKELSTWTVVGSYRLPAMAASFSSESVNATMKISSQSEVVGVSVLAYVTDSPVAAAAVSASPLCANNPTNLSVSCIADRLLPEGAGGPSSASFSRSRQQSSPSTSVNSPWIVPVRANVPAFFSSVLVLRMHVTALNARGVQFDMVVNTSGATALSQVTAPPSPSDSEAPASAATIVRNIFSLNPCQGYVNFVAATWAVFLVITVAKVAWRANRMRKSPDICYPSVEGVSASSSLIPKHIYIALLRPCHVHCGPTHSLQLAVHILGIYFVASLLLFGGEELLAETQRLWIRLLFTGGVAAAVSTAFMQPLVDLVFWLYRTVDRRVFHQAPTASPRHSTQDLTAFGLRPLEAVGFSEATDRKLDAIAMCDRPTASSPHPSGAPPTKVASPSAKPSGQAKGTRYGTARTEDVTGPSKAKGKAHAPRSVGAATVYGGGDDFTSIEHVVPARDVDDADTIDLPPSHNRTASGPEASKQDAKTAQVPFDPVAKAAEDPTETSSSENSARDKNIVSGVEAAAKSSNDASRNPFYDPLTMVTVDSSSYTALGSVICVALAIGLGIGTLWMTSTRCGDAMLIFAYAVATALAIDIVLLQPLLMLLTLGYRYVAAEDEPVHMLHPYQGAALFVGEC